MLKKAQRLSNRQFSEIMEKGRVVNSPPFLLRYVIGQPDKRFSVVAPVKIGKTAVIRNQCRRVIYACLKEIFPYLINGVRGIIFSRKIVSSNDRQNIKDDLLILLNKVKLTKNV